MPEFDYRCTDCGAVTPVDLVDPERWEGNPEQGYPPEEVKTVCGERYGGCSRLQWMELVDE